MKTTPFLALAALASLAGAARADDFQLQPANSRRCLDVQGVSQADGTPIQIYDCLGAQQTNQLWRFSGVGNGSYQIEAVHSGKCLDVTSASPDNGARIQQYTCLGAQQMNQLWLVDQVGNDLYRIRSASSGKCLDVTGVGVANGTLMQQWDCTGAANQQFYLVPVGDDRQQPDRGHDDHHDWQHGDDRWNHHDDNRGHQDWGRQPPQPMPPPPPPPPPRPMPRPLPPPPAPLPPPPPPPPAPWQPACNATETTPITACQNGEPVLRPDLTNCSEDCVQVPASCNTGLVRNVFNVICR